MNQTATLEKKPMDVYYYIKTLIGLAIMIFFGYLPAPAPITHTGMIILGQFIGLIFLWTFVDMVWPNFVAIVLFGFVAMDVYPKSTAMAGIYEAGAQSFGNWIILIVLGILIYVEVLNDTGIIRRMSLWFITRDAAKKGPWAFTFMFLLAAYVVGCFMNVTAAQLILFALAKEVFEITGMKTDDKWPKVITIGITFTVIIAYCATPFSHELSLLFMGIYGAIAGVPVNWLGYTLIAFPVCTLIWLAIFAFFRFIVKPDVSMLEKMDFSKIDAMRPGKMKKKEKFVVLISVLLIITWLLPGFLSVLAPTSVINVFLHDITMVTPLFVALILFAIVRFDGEPVLDFAKAASKISWMVMFFLTGIMLIATAMGEPTTGISAWLLQTISPMVQGMSPFMLVTALGIFAILLTNVANNVPTGIILITIGVPLSLQMGINPFITAVAITVGSQLAYCIPPAFVPIGFCYADPYGGAKYTFRWGVVATIISCVAILLVYPLGLLFG